MNRTNGSNGAPVSAVVLEKPQNGFAGLKHWRYDIPAGLVVSLISLPFSLGIAIASGAPPICGIISAIIAGMVLPFLGGSFVTISGPAAGLAPALLAAMMLLGNGNREVGYPLLLAAISIVGVVQIILAKLKLAKLGEMFPVAVVEGMLAAIGLMIIAKQLPLILGRKFEAHEFWHILAEVPSQISQANPVVVGIGVSCLALIFALSAIKAKWLKIIPPAVIAAAFGLGLSLYFGLDAQYRVQIPADPFKHGIVMPDFAGVWADKGLWWSVFTVVLTLTLIDGIESLATIAAVDRIDPFKRKSDPNRTLFAMGMSNIASSLGGGLTIIPGGVKSTANVVSGGRTQWANFYNACFLIVYLLLGQGVINSLPLAALGAVVTFMGWKLCKPHVWKEISTYGYGALFNFSLVVFVTVTFDLLYGIAVGMIWEFCALALRATRTAPRHQTGISRFERMRGLFRSPVRSIEAIAEVPVIHVNRPITCFNWHYLETQVRLADSKEAEVIVDFEGAPFLDSKSHEGIESLEMEFIANGRKLTVRGLEGMDPLASNQHSMLVRKAPELALVD